MLKRFLMVALAFFLMAAGLPNMRVVEWQVVDLPIQNTLLDIAFTGTDANHGWIVGDKGTLLETRDGGVNWQPHTLETSNPDYYLTSVSFAGDEGWIVGEPKVLLHTEDGGSHWSQIILSSKLPGEPLKVTALGSHSAEMVSNVGAIYRTQDDGKTWKAMVADSIGVIKNVARREDGAYLAVSSRGSFYFLYSPASQAWKPFPRESSRRIQNMGFGPDGIAWKLNQGAEITLTDDVESGHWNKGIRPGKALSFGYLGAAYQDPQNLWVVGGSALLIHSPDGGKTWEQARKISNVPANFYTISFPQPQKGFILGQNGTLLRYAGNA
ncbi:MAG: photosynthesis system II assembly factor Ycf48 [Cyanobacteriota bacterium]|nr:photosynthesis system II assembly factor Ycf48 [Cyanobacteriota bacterium]